MKNSKNSIVVSKNCNFLEYVCLGCSIKNTLRVKRFSADGFGGLHKMSIVRGEWVNVYEDCEYLEYGGFFRKNFRHKCMRCGLGIMAGLDWSCYT